MTHSGIPRFRVDATGREFHELLHAEYVKGCEEAEKLHYDEKVKRLAELWAEYRQKVEGLFKWARERKGPDCPECGG
jgi:hypothetical protein